MPISILPRMHSIGNVYWRSVLLLKDRQSTSLTLTQGGDAANRHFVCVPSIIDRAAKTYQIESLATD